MGLRYSAPKRLPGKGVRYYSRIYDPSTGRRTWVSCETNNKRAAAEWVTTRQVEAAQGLERAANERFAALRFSEAVALFLAEKEQKTSSYRHSELTTIAAAFWLPYFGGKLLRDISSEDLRAYLAKRKAGALISPHTRRKAPLPLSARTLNNDVANLRTFFRFARRSRWIRENPAEDLTKYSGEVKRRRRFLAIEEEAALLQACRAATSMVISAKRNSGGPRGGAVTGKPSRWTQKIPGAEALAPLAMVAMRCGFRRRTLCCLEWQHLSFDAERWNIPGELMKVPQDYLAPCPRCVVEELRAYRARLLEKYGSTRIAPDARIFGLRDTSRIGRLVGHAAARAGLGRVTLHDLRRHYLNALRRSGIPLETAMALTAHRSIKTVRDFYLEIPQEELQEAVRALEERRPLPAPKALKAPGPRSTEMGVEG